MRIFVAVLLLSSAVAHAADTNLLRNGSFEGGLLYWHGIKPDQHTLVRGDAKVGEFALRIEQGAVMSAPFVARPGAPTTVSFWVKAEQPGEVRVQMPPSAREPGQKAGRLWTREGTQSAKVGTDWQRVAFTWPANVPQEGFWPNPHYMIQIESSKPILVDGVTVGSQQWVPRRAVEIIADCPDMPGYTSPAANLFDRGATVRITAHASNPGTESCDVTLRWQLFDYEGIQPLGAAVDKQVTIPAGKTVSRIVPLELTHTGCVIARVSAISGDRSEIDHADFPLTSLPYPKSATQPDGRERFGGSLWGPHLALQQQKIGFAWTRWHPHMNGQDHWPKPDEPMKFFDQELAMLHSHGISTHCVLYPPPKWIMESGNPLPKDMRWPADDPRWDDFTIETVWDKFVRAAVGHYRGRSLVYEIENEPELDHWDKLQDEYARFTLRTARLIKQTDPQAKVMVDNVYGIPSGLNRHFLEQGGGKFIDIISWHDYHEGWLADGTAIRRMRQNLDALGCRHIEIWFNEGWAFTNTLVDEPPACTHLTSVQSCHAMADSVAEMTVNGQEKTILFHTGYEQHGMSFWDYSGPGTMLWDWYGYPLPLVAAWNVLSHHIGLSTPVAFVRPPGANFCIFDDLRNRRGVMIAYADREAKADVPVELPLDDLTAEDLMGNVGAAPQTLVLSKTGRPVILYSAAAGKTFAEKFAPLDRKHASFVTAGTAATGASYRLPATWEKDNPAMADGKPIWRLDQIWPADPTQSTNFRPLVWRDNWWRVTDNEFGGQPKAELKDNAVRLEFRAAHGQPPAPRLCGLVFIAPQAGAVSVRGSAELRMWDGKNPVRLNVLHKTKEAVTELASLKLTPQQPTVLTAINATLAAGDELVLLPKPEGVFAGGDVTLCDLVIGPGRNTASTIYRLPATWEQDNPIVANGKPIWRLDQLWPDHPELAESYIPLPWSGTEWKAVQHAHGGQPSARVENGTFTAGVRAPWTGNPGQKTCGVVFITPKSGTYVATGTARIKPWEGSAKAFQLGIFKKGTANAVAVQTLELPRDNSPVPFEVRVELTAGHELVFLPLMTDWHNAGTVKIEGLAIAQQE
jgi:hypothetical protein